MDLKALALVLLSGLLLSGCVREQARQKELMPFFSLELFVTAETERLENEGIRLEKTIELNGTIETKTFETNDWDKELSFLKSADINKPAWFDLYRADTIENSNDQLSVVYTALMDDLKTKTIQVDFIENRLTKLRFRQRVENVFYFLEQEAEYVPEKGFTLIGYQKIRFFSENSYRIEASFSPVSVSF